MMADPIFGAMGAASSGMETQSFRMRTTAENLSNIDTPGYRRKLLFFEAMKDGGVELSRLDLSREAGKERYDPYHPLADDRGMVTLSNVDAMVELADAREARRSFDANLQVFRQAQGFYRGLLSVLER
ncbi:flagellar basal body protein [Parvularcula lutaonensis]|uniref:Flagellar basal body protein n=1 Tax=Parvularcula lutaonensis TaxID=491923 RepID=A0ABV7M8B3_9PROT|nr:flagellar basal body protein [Parvularcula lutaonensis]GGY43863.1 flagellar basal body rod protein FlgC [Parvularcula lutaonensis]